ncbi:MAG: hypothetical protein QOD51_2562, partial [Candidatus Eremiobacteraeota bacterium]|nr:hypothetical protein [Candidatus Eremiobacteraeota bacterium]
MFASTALSSLLNRVSIRAPTRRFSLYNTALEVSRLAFSKRYRYSATLCHSVDTATRDNSLMSDNNKVDLADLTLEIQRLECEQRVRLRHWIDGSFDACGRPRAVPLPIEAALKAYALHEFERANIRQFEPPGTRKYRGLPCDSGGIYALASDCDWLYVGKAKSLIARRNSHASALRHGSHPNVLLQRHWNHDNAPLWFVVLERWERNFPGRGAGEHRDELKWKRLLRPLYDRESR